MVPPNLYSIEGLRSILCSLGICRTQRDSKTALDLDRASTQPRDGVPGYSRRQVERTWEIQQATGNPMVYVTSKTRQCLSQVLRALRTDLRQEEPRSISSRVLLFPNPFVLPEAEYRQQLPRLNNSSIIATCGNTGRELAGEVGRVY